VHELFVPLPIAQIVDACVNYITIVGRPHICSHGPESPKKNPKSPPHSSFSPFWRLVNVKHASKKYKNFSIRVFNRFFEFYRSILASDLDSINILTLYNCNYLTNVSHNKLKSGKERKLHLINKKLYF